MELPSPLLEQTDTAIIATSDSQGSLECRRHLKGSVFADSMIERPNGMSGWHRICIHAVDKIRYHESAIIWRQRCATTITIVYDQFYGAKV
jgi:hypothetical protein